MKIEFIIRRGKKEASVKIPETQVQNWVDNRDMTGIGCFIDLMLYHFGITDKKYKEKMKEYETL